MKKKAPRYEKPSAASVREIPETDFSTGVVRRNPHAGRMRKEGVMMPGPDGNPVHMTYDELTRQVQREARIQVRRGRPRLGENAGPTVTRSVRFPPEVWAKLEKKAQKAGLPLHAALRTAVLKWLKTG